MTGSSVIYDLTSEEFKQFVESAASTSDLLRMMGLGIGGNNYLTLKKRLILEGFDPQILVLKSRLKLKALVSANTHTLDDYLTNTHPIKSTRLKAKLLTVGLIEEVCASCNQGPTWNNKPLTLQLDHVNGVNTDNRLENLRLLCPNCHTQTDTYAGRSLKRQNHCIECGSVCSKGRLYCLECKMARAKMTQTSFVRPAKINWPSKEELEKLVWEMPRTELALQLGVSDKAIAKHCRKLEIPQPPRGYWQRNYDDQKLIALSYNVRFAN